MKVIGLTGGIASGKSLVSAILQKLGAIILDADVVARQVVEPHKPAWEGIVKSFGKQVLNEDETINRTKLGEIIFKEKARREMLNNITHPEIIKAIHSDIEKFRLGEKQGHVMVVDVPLLIEVGLDKMVDEVWVVYVRPEIQLERLMNRDKISEEQAKLRIGSQMHLEEKLKYADEIIDNNKDPITTKRQVVRLWSDIF